MSSFSHNTVRGTLAQPMDVTRRKQQPQQPRQLLSCTKCRERKVKCDRTKPCSACCARGAPKECHFVAEGGDYAPIQQSYELRKLRAENLRLKERLRTSKIYIEDDDSDQSSESQPGDRSRASSTKRRVARQKRFQGSEWSDSIYFGSPGIANIIADFATVNLTPRHAQSLAHHMPRGPDIFISNSPSTYPFATLFPATPEECIPQLLDILPPRKELQDYLAAFEKRVYVCAFPHLPVELTKNEIDRFLDDPERNARMCPEMLALIFAAIALGAQHSVWDQCAGSWKAEVVDAEAQRGNVYVAAAMQALRLSSFMHKPSLLAIETLIMIGPFLSNSGRFLDAWTLFGTTVRLAQAIGLHRHPKYLDPAPPTQGECAIRQTLWWWMLHMDEQYSMTLGRPLGISGIGDCPPPHELTTDPRMLRFGEFINHFTILARQILSSDRLTNAKIDEFTDQLRGLLDTMPEMLQFDDSWLDKDKEIPEWPLSAMSAVYYCKTHTYLILLNRQRSDKSETPHGTTTKATSAFRAVNRPPSSHASPTTSWPSLQRGRPMVLSSAAGILTAFLYFYTRAQASLVSWTIGQQAFNSSMLLLLDALETGNLSHVRKVEHAYIIFRELQDNGVHKLASLAVEKLSWGLDQLRASFRENATFRTIDKTDAKLTAHVSACVVREGSRDTVMSNTGMLLVEEQGLQSYMAERFAPVTCSNTEAVSEATTPSHLKQEQDPQFYGLPDLLANEMSKRSSKTVPISKELQDSAESPLRPALERHCAPSSQQRFQPQRSVTGPASPMSLAASVAQHNHNEASSVSGHHRQQQKQLPRLQHSKARQTTPSSVKSHDERPDSGTGSGESVAFTQAWHPLAPSPRNDDVSAAQSRHHSCPAPYELATTPPLLPPTYSSPLANKLQSPLRDERYDVHMQWSANHTAPMMDIMDSGMIISPTTEQGHVVPNIRHRTARQQRMMYQYPFPYHSMATSTAEDAAMNVEQMTIDQWKRWVDSGAHG